MATSRDSRGLAEPDLYANKAPRRSRPAMVMASGGDGDALTSVVQDTLRFVRDRARTRMATAKVALLMTK